MDLSYGYPFWLIKTGLPFNYPFLEKDIKTDVLVIGGGISGALMLYYLANAGINCVLIDRRTIGLGSTAASTSLLQYEIDIPLVELTEKIGMQNAITAYRLCSDAIDKLERIALKSGFRDFERKQSLYYAAFKKDISFLKKEYAMRKKAGFDIKLLDESSIKNKFGFTAAAALLSKQGAQTNAYEFTHALLQYCIKKGSSVFDRTEAVSIKYSRAGINIRTGKGNTIKATRLINATGYESLEYIDPKFVKLKSTYAICSEQMNKKYLASLKEYIIWNTADPYLYMRLTNDNRVLVGGRDEDYYDPKRRDALLPRKVKQLTKDFKKLFPAIPFIPEFSWAGTFGSTRDGLPFIGNYGKRKESFFSLGFGGNGITFSLIAAEMIMEMLQGKKNKQQELFSFNRI